MAFRRISTLCTTLIVDHLFYTHSSFSCNKVALIKLDAIGDFLIWLNAAKSLSEHFGKENIILIANECNSELAKGLPFFGGAYFVDINKFTHSLNYRIKTIKDVGRMNIGTALHCTYSRVFDVGDAIVRATGATHRIGSIGNFSNISIFEKSISDRWYTNLIPASKGIKHEASRHEEFLKGIGLQEYVANIYHMPKISNHPNIYPNENYYVVFPGASWIGRQWEKEKYVDLINRLTQIHAGQCVLCGGKDEIQLCDWIKSNCKHQENILNHAGKTSFPDFLEVVRNANFLVGNESSCIHAAAVVRTPAICILGGGHFGRFLPYNGFNTDTKIKIAFQEMECFHCNWKCTRKHSRTGPMPCIEMVSVETVLSLCKEFVIK